MKKIISAAGLLIALFGVLLISACGSKVSVHGTWTFEKVVKDGTSYTVDEIKSLGEDTVGSDVMSMIDSIIVIKESDQSDSGQAFISSAGQTGTVEWSLDGKTITIGKMECEVDGDYIVISTDDDSKMYFKKTSDSQDITNLTNNNTEEQKEEPESDEPAKEDTSVDEQPEEPSPAPVEDPETDTSAYDTIIANATSDIEQGVADLNSEWETLKSKIDSYDSYVKHSSEVEEFYKNVLAKNSELCTLAYVAALDYAKAVAASGDDIDKYDQAKYIEKDIYDGICDIINEGIYEDLFKAVNKHFYEGVLDDSDESGVSFDDWYDTKSDEYDQWYDTKSDVYDEWYDSKSDIYSFYYDLSSEFYSDDADRAQKEIDKFEEKINKRK